MHLIIIPLLLSQIHQFLCYTFKHLSNQSILTLQVYMIHPLAPLIQFQILDQLICLKLIFLTFIYDLIMIRS